MNKQELVDYLKEYKLTYDFSEDYRNIYNACVDYMNESQDWDIEECFQDIITYDLAEEQAKYELERGGLVRLYYFLGNANCNNDLFRINGYGNLEDANSDTMKCLIDEIIERLED